MGVSASQPSNPAPFSNESHFAIPRRVYTASSSSLIALVTSCLDELSSFESLLSRSPSPPNHLLLTSRARVMDGVRLPSSLALHYEVGDDVAYRVGQGVTVSPIAYVMSGGVSCDCAHEAVALHEQWMSVKFLTLHDLMRKGYQRALHVSRRSAWRRCSVEVQGR